MRLICSGFRNDVYRRSACSAKLGRVIAAVDLKLVNGILAQIAAHTARVVIRLAAVYRDIVSAAIASVERKPALRCLLYAKVLITRKTGRV